MKKKKKKKKKKRKNKEERRKKKERKKERKKEEKKAKRRKGSPYHHRRWAARRWKPTHGNDQGRWRTTEERSAQWGIIFLWKGDFISWSRRLHSPRPVPHGDPLTQVRTGLGARLATLPATRDERKNQPAEGKLVNDVHTLPSTFTAQGCSKRPQTGQPHHWDPATQGSVPPCAEGTRQDRGWRRVGKEEKGKKMGFTWSRQPKPNHFFLLFWFSFTLPSQRNRTHLWGSGLKGILKGLTHETPTESCDSFQSKILWIGLPFFFGGHNEGYRQEFGFSFSGLLSNKNLIVW